MVARATDAAVSAAPMQTLAAPLSPNGTLPALAAAGVDVTPPALPSSGSGGAHGNGQGKGTGSGAGNGTGAGGGPFGVGAGGTGSGLGLRHIVYLLDISGSMVSRIDRARQELKNALAGLVPGETFNIIAFSTRVRPFDSVLDPPTPEMRARADFFLSTLEPDGGTNLEGALTEALALPSVNVVVLITDGVPTQTPDGQGIKDKDYPAYLSNLPPRIRALNVRHARIDTVGLVGKDQDGKDQTFPASRLLQQIAAGSGGTFRVVPLGIAAL